MDNYSIDGLAGVGKTTKMIEMANQVADDGYSVLIITFNKKLQIEISNKITHENIQVTTLHSLAYRRINKQVDNFFSFISIKNLYPILSNKEATIIYNLFNLWTYSKDEISEFCQKVFNSTELLEYLSNVNKLEIKNLENIIQNIVDSFKNKTTHNLYLKEFQLSKPSIDSDIIFIDEYQDFSTVMIDIIESFNKPVYKFGDFNQKIYTWRNATGMFNIPFKVIELNETKRCPQEFCDIANNYLSLLTTQKINSSFNGGKTNGYSDNPPLVFNSDTTFISNYNTLIIENILKLGFKYNIKLISDIDLQKLEEVWNYIYNKPKATAWMLKFNSLCNLEKYYQDTENVNMLTLIKCAKLITNFNNFQEMLTFYDESVPTITFTNVYISKGLEWDNVVILNDFENINNSKYKIMSKDFIRYIYVAVTRAKKILYVPNFILEPFSNQDNIIFLDDAFDVVENKENELKIKKSCCEVRYKRSLEDSLASFKLQANVTTLSKDDIGLKCAIQMDKENKRRGVRDKNGGGKYANANRYIESKITGVPLKNLQLRDRFETYLPTDQDINELGMEIFSTL